MRYSLSLILTCLLLAGCAASPDRYAAPAPQVTERQRIAFAAVEISEISLPAYAASDEISVQAADGRLISDGATLWADTPDRIIGLELSRYLVQITGARVASSPWPFDAFPDARLSLRFEELVAGADGQFRASGQYFVGVTEGRERAGLFDLAVPFDPEVGPAAIAAARAQIILDLALFLARNGLR